MKRIILATLTALILIMAAILVVDAQIEEGILNKLTKQHSPEEKETVIAEENVGKANQLVQAKHLEQPEQKKVKKAPAAAKIASEVKTVQDRSAIIVIDPGHQERGNLEQEPVSPGSSETKPKVSSGTSGATTNKPEYQLTLEYSLRLQEVLEDKGYDVILTRTSNQVDISNIERAEIANAKNADLFLRIHADGSESADTHGFSVLTPGRGNQYRENIYDPSLSAANKIVAQAAKGIPLHQDGIFYRDDLTGFNWSKVPVVLIELGFMTNPEEDMKLSDRTYLEKLVNLIADGVEDYVEEEKH